MGLKTNWTYLRI